MEDFIMETLSTTPTASRALEIVERKGTGHPDYICDAVMEAVSLALSREYIRRAGRVLHHNIDKGLLIAGSVEKCFGGGKVTNLMELVIGDRATFSSGGVDIPVEEIAREAALNWVGENLPDVDTETDISVRVALRPGSAELSGIFSPQGAAPLLGANDTSATVGLAPRTPTEETVYALERHLNSAGFKAAFPETGADVKVMGVRRGRSLDLVVACPLLARFVKSEKEYFERKEAVETALKDFTSTLPFDEVVLGLNTLDRPGLGEAGVYISLLGTSAEDGDSGEVGRGNTIRGVIAPCRASSTEAAAGKNPVSHVGKIYAVLAQNLADEIYATTEGVDEARVYLVSRIGDPLDKPAHVYVQLLAGSGLDEKKAADQVRGVLEDALSSVEALVDDLIKGVYAVC